MARIGAYQFGRIVVDGQQETRDLIVLPNRVVRNWWRQEGHRLVLDDLQDVLEELPERLLIGTGADGRLCPDPAALDRLRVRGIKVEALPTATAVRRYGELDPARTAAASTSPAEACRPARQRIAPQAGGRATWAAAVCHGRVTRAHPAPPVAG